MDLSELGLDAFLRAQLDRLPAGLEPMRVASAHKGGLDVWGERGEARARLPGRLLRELRGERELAVGDWVGVRFAATDPVGVIEQVLERKSAFVRRAAGREEAAQVVAANVDTVLLVIGLDGDFSLRRLERYLAQLHQSGARPVVVLNKADLCTPAEAEARRREAEEHAPGVPVHVVSALRPDTLVPLGAYTGRGQTVALVGSSGTGKSTLANALVGEARMAVGAVRAHDERGRHTTTRRQLLRLSGGGLLLDTPGMRELGLWQVGEGLDETFEEVAEVAADCRFADCRHAGEPGCAVAAALAEGRLDPERVEHYRRLLAETAGGGGQGRGGGIRRGSAPPPRRPAPRRRRPR